MSWSVNIIGKAGTVAAMAANEFKKNMGAPAGTPEKVACDALGDVVAGLCAGYSDPNTIVKIEASGSAWNEAGKHRSLDTRLSVSTLGPIVE